MQIRIRPVDLHAVTPPLLAYVLGARPNCMKVAPIHAALARSGAVEQRIVHTGQHYDREMAAVFHEELGLPAPDVQLDVGSGSHAEQTAAALVGVERALLELRPALVVVAGDVNSTLAGALAAVKLGLPVCHVEAGLRSFDRTMPEEHNRRIVDHLSSLLLVHSEDAVHNLAAEGIAGPHVSFVGNTMIDTLLAFLDEARALAAWCEHGVEQRGYLLVTLHRPSLVDDPGLLERTLAGLDELARDLPVLFPVHPRTRAQIASAGRLTLLPPLPYRMFLSLEAGAAAVVTDSGGVQEETTALGVPCFTLRTTTERPVTVSHGTNVVLGLEPERLLEIPGLLAGARPARVPPLWDGHAGQRAADAVLALLDT